MNDNATPDDLSEGILDEDERDYDRWFGFVMTLIAFVVSAVICGAMLINSWHNAELKHDTRRIEVRGAIEQTRINRAADVEEAKLAPKEIDRRSDWRCVINRGGVSMDDRNCDGQPDRP